MSIHASEEEMITLKKRKWKRHVRRNGMHPGDIIPKKLIKRKRKK